MEEEGEGEKESRVNDTMEENKKFLRTLSSHEVCLTFTLFSMLNLVSKQFQKSTIIFIKRQTLFRQHQIIFPPLECKPSAEFLVH